MLTAQLEVIRYKTLQGSEYQVLGSGFDFKNQKVA